MSVINCINIVTKHLLGYGPHHTWVSKESAHYTQCMQSFLVYPVSISSTSGAQRPVSYPQALMDEVT